MCRCPGRGVCSGGEGAVRCLSLDGCFSFQKKLTGSLGNEKTVSFLQSRKVTCPALGFNCGGSPQHPLPQRKRCEKTSKFNG